MMLLIACGDGKPRGVLSEEKMKEVLWDVAVAGEFANGYLYYQNPSQNRVVINNKLMDEIYRVHDITKKQFDRSLEYYKKNPRLLMTMLDSIAVKKGGPGALPPGDPALGNPPGNIMQPRQMPEVLPPAVAAGADSTFNAPTPTQ